MKKIIELQDKRTWTKELKDIESNDIIGVYEVGNIKERYFIKRYLANKNFMNR